MRIKKLQQHHCSSIFKERYYEITKNPKNIKSKGRQKFAELLTRMGLIQRAPGRLLTLYLYSRDRHVGPCNCENKTIAIVIMSVVHNRKTPQECFLFHSKTEIKSKTYRRNMWLDLGLRSFKLWFRVSVVGEEILQKVVCGSVQKGSASAVDNRKAP
jgi:hypothetical protein